MNCRAVMWRRRAFASGGTETCGGVSNEQLLCEADKTESALACDALSQLPKAFSQLYDDSTSCFCL
jgi:hypothetical protein